MHEYAQKSTTTTLPRRLSRRERLAVEPAGRPIESGQRPFGFRRPACALRRHHRAAFGGLFRGRHHHGAAARRLRAGLARLCAAARFDARTVTGFATYSAGNMALEVAHLRKIVDDDVGIRRVIEQVVLVVALGFVEAFQRVDARDDARADTHRPCRAARCSLPRSSSACRWCRKWPSDIACPCPDPGGSAASGHAPRRRTPAGSGRR